MPLERMTATDPQSFLTCLWELHDGTRACVVEHRVEPRWELCIVRQGRVVRGRRYESIADLMAKSLAEYVSASGG